VRNEIGVEIDRAQIEPRLAFTRENYRMMREEQMKIVYWKPEDSEVGLPKPPKVLINPADIKSAGGVAPRVRTQGAAIVLVCAGELSSKGIRRYLAKRVPSIFI
jgi:hypothetical protein